jgi:methylenetetrahydrofolate reductase (NADPH)
MSKAPAVSFEFFPPRTPEMEESLWRALQRLAPLRPAFVSVTYGAGGSTRERTHATVARILAETTLSPAAHLTCVAASRDAVDGVARSYRDLGVRHVVALRGDPPEAGTPFVPHADGYTSAAELVAGLRRIGDFEISVAAYPERHPDSPSWEHEIANLKRKTDAGATRAITQFFFEADDFLRLRDRMDAAGIAIPLVPGVMPVTNFRGIERFAGLCGAAIPNWLRARFDGLDDDPETRAMVAAQLAVEFCGRLRDHGVDHFHFYTLNRAELTYGICHMLGVRPHPAPTGDLVGAKA